MHSVGVTRYEMAFGREIKTAFGEGMVIKSMEMSMYREVTQFTKLC